MADTVIENLITQLSLEFDDDQLKKFDKAVGSAAKGLLAIVAGATAAAAAIFTFTQSIAKSNDELGKFAKEIGVDIAALQELGFVAELNGGSIDSMNGSLANLSRISSEAARGIGAGVEAFGILGVAVTNAEGRIKSADDLLFDVSDAIARLGTQAEKLELAQKLGIGSDLLLAIQNGSEAIKQQRKEARELGFVIDKDAAEAAADFNDELLKQTKIISGVASAIGTRLMKQITPFVQVTNDWFKANRKIIQQNLVIFLDKLTNGIKIVFNITARVIGIINSLVAAMGGWQNSIIAVTGLLIALNASALLMPILIIAAGAAILLILEDVIKFAEGGDSALGDLADRFPVFEKLLRGLLFVLGLVRDGWVAIFEDGALAFNDLIDVITEFGVKIKKSVLAPVDKVLELFGKISEINFGAAAFAAGGGGGAIAPSITESIIRTQQAREQGGSTIPGNINNRSVTNNTTNKPNVTLNINGGDTDKVRQVVSDVLSEQYSGAQTNLESQVEF